MWSARSGLPLSDQDQCSKLRVCVFPGISFVIDPELSPTAQSAAVMRR